MYEENSRSFDVTTASILLKLETNSSEVFFPHFQVQVVHYPGNPWSPLWLNHRFWSSAELIFLIHKYFIIHLLRMCPHRYGSFHLKHASHTPTPHPPSPTQTRRELSIRCAEWHLPHMEPSCPKYTVHLYPHKQKTQFLAPRECTHMCIESKPWCLDLFLSVWKCSIGNFRSILQNYGGFLAHSPSIYSISSASLLCNRCNFFLHWQLLYPLFSLAWQSRSKRVPFKICLSYGS